MTDMPDVLGILPLRGTVIFPQAVVTLGAGRLSSVRLIEEALQGSRVVGAVMQRDAAEDNPDAAGLRWWSRWEALWANVTLFDRAAPALRLATVRALTLDDPAVLEAADLFGLRVMRAT